MNSVLLAVVGERFALKLELHKFLATNLGILDFGASWSRVITQPRSENIWVFIRIILGALGLVIFVKDLKTKISFD